MHNQTKPPIETTLRTTSHQNHPQVNLPVIAHQNYVSH